MAGAGRGRMPLKTAQCTGQQADRNVRLSDRRESASNRIVEFRRHQLVLDLGGPVRDLMQTVVTHRRHSSSWKSRDFSPDPRTGVKISAFPTPPKDTKLPIVTRPFNGIVATGARAVYSKPDHQRLL